MNTQLIKEPRVQLIFICCGLQDLTYYTCKYQVLSIIICNKLDQVKMSSTQFPNNTHDSVTCRTKVKSLKSLAHESGYQDQEILKIRLYHGTSQSSAKQIAQSKKLLKTPYGTHGKGVYFVQSYDYALKIAKDRAESRGENGYAVITCFVQSVLAPQWLSSGFHPPWGPIDHEFKVFCLDKGELTIEQIQLFQKDTKIKLI